MRLPVPPSEPARPGIILIQVDGLSRTQFKKAVREGRLPFLSSLVNRRHFTLTDFYSGVPSTTPAVQGEIFYGKKSVVPGFHFLDRETGRDFSMYDAESARIIEEEMASESEPLLEGGNGYSNVYRAGATKTRYCSQDLAPNEFFRGIKLWRWAVLLTLHLPRMLKICALAIIEFFLAVFDMLRGQFKGEDTIAELKFIPARIAVSMVVRELIRFRVQLDIEAGVRVIHANFLGYDEQSHRRGPGSGFAHRTLSGIDRAIRDFHYTASHSDIRDYELMIYSDHGQEHTIPFEIENGRPLIEAVEEAFSDGPLSGTEVTQRNVPIIWENIVSGIRSSLGFNRHSEHWEQTKPDYDHQIFVAAMGPLGHIYLPGRLSDEDKIEYAKKLVSLAKIPLVMIRDSSGQVHAFKATDDCTLYSDKVYRVQSLTLPRDGEKVLGSDHPYITEVSEDLVGMFDCKYIGDFLISGWRPGHQPMTFPIENGAHAGPGSEETRGFLLIPDRLRHWHIHHFPQTKNYVRGEGIYEIVRHYLGRDGEERNEIVPERDDDMETTGIRVMTYNIHSCIGMDGKVRPERIARVINHCEADIIGIQEIDSHRERSGRQDQSQKIANHLRMNHVFKTMLEEKHDSREQYGIGVFSRYPFEVVKSDLLTPAGRGRLREARGAIWAKVDIGGPIAVNVINTHFGLARSDRFRQMSQLLSDEWIGDIPEDEPLILCGDFNTPGTSGVFRGLWPRLRDSQKLLSGHRIRPTFPVSVPLLRLDHIFISHHFTVEEIEIPNTPTANLASDHRAVCVRLTIEEPTE